MSVALFAGYDANGNNGLWVTDGTAAGTHDPARCIEIVWISSIARILPIYASTFMPARQKSPGRQPAAMRTGTAKPQQASSWA